MEERDLEIENLNEMTYICVDDLETFLKAPRKAQEIFFVGVALTDVPPFAVKTYFPTPTIEPDLTPIETIFKIAYDVYCATSECKFHRLESQYEINLSENKRYIVDFYNEESNLIIECDGHDFHQKTKKQVVYDNQREYNLKMAGYNIVRFSGSQIYNEPFKCAKETYTYIEKILKG